MAVLEVLLVLVYLLAAAATVTAGLPDRALVRMADRVLGAGLVGRAIRCASAQDQLRMHQGYEPRPVDFVDVCRVAGRFGLPLPPGLEEPRLSRRCARALRRARAHPSGGV